MTSQPIAEQLQGNDVSSQGNNTPSREEVLALEAT